MECLFRPQLLTCLANHTIIIYSAISHTMIRLTTLRQGLTNLHLAADTIEAIKPYTQPDNQFPLLNFSQKGRRPSWLASLVRPVDYRELFQLYLNFVTQGQEQPEGIAYHLIEPGLRTKILKWLKDHRARVQVQKCRVLESEEIEKFDLSGVFIHRQYNLNQDSYEVEQRRKDKKAFVMKSILPLRAYKLQLLSQKMEQFYHASYHSFLKNKQICRYFVEMSVDLHLSLHIGSSRTQNFGLDGPSKHLLHIESVTNPYSMVEENTLCDVDFLMGGNPHCRKYC